MKYFYSILLAVAMMPLTTNAQFSENFENVSLSQGVGNVPTGWTVYDQDGNMPDPYVGFMTQAWRVATFDGVNKVALSTSFYTPTGQSDDWMVTPQINVPSTTPFLLFEEWNTDPNSPGAYEVLISTTGNTPADFSSVIHSESNPSNNLTPVAVDLSTYADQQVYIAYRNVGNDEYQYLLVIDNVEVLSLPNDDIGILDVQLPRYAANSTNNTLEVTVKNFGGNVINSVDIEWSDGTNTYTHSATGLSLQPYTTTVITHSTPINYSSVVEKSISVRAVNTNGQTDANLQDNTGQTLFNTLSQTPTKYVVIEEGTGTWCGYCPRGIIAMEYMYANPALFPNFIGIAVHNGDPMVVPEYDNGVDLSGYPGCNVDRVLLGKSVNKTLWINFYNARKNLVSPVEISIASSYDQTTREVTANLSANFYTNFSQADFRFAVVMVEDGVTGTSNGYSQTNYYSDAFGQDQGSMGYFDNLPFQIPASDMVYDRVGIALLGGYDGQAGSIPSTINDGDVATYSYTYTLPSSVDASEVKLVALVLDNTTGAILNAKEKDPNLGVAENPVAVRNIQVYPNPASDFVNVSFGMEMTDDVQLNIYSMSGALVKTQNFQNMDGNQTIQVDISGLSIGQYLLSLSTSQGSVVKNIIVK